MLISFDAQKVFDIVNWELLFKTMSGTGFYSKCINNQEQEWMMKSEWMRLQNCSEGWDRETVLNPPAFSYKRWTLGNIYKTELEKDVGNTEHKISLYLTF